MSGCALVIGTMASYAVIQGSNWYRAENARQQLSASLITPYPNWTEADINSNEPPAKAAQPMPKPVKPIAKQAMVMPTHAVPTTKAVAVIAKVESSKQEALSTSRIWESNTSHTNSQAVVKFQGSVVAQTAKPTQDIKDFKLVDLPATTMAMIQVGSVVRAVQVGEKLPSGDTIQSIDIDAKSVTVVSGKKFKLP